MKLDLSAERDNIVLPVSIEHKVISELRRVNHHQEITVTKFIARAGVNNISKPAPGIDWFKCNLNEEQTKFTDPLNNLADGIISLFSNHCKQFIAKSSSIRELLLQHLEPNSL